MRNRHDGANSSGWWDDLPPAVRRRIARPSPTQREESSAGRPNIFRDLSRLAVLFLLIAIANLFFLAIALSFIVRGQPTVR
jgi:hypothetical protein